MAKLEPTCFSPAPTVARIAQELIAEHHEHLLGRRIVCLFSSKEKKTNGKVALGWVTVVSGLAAYFAADPEANLKHTGEPFFLMVIDRGAWNFQLNTKQKIALVDHELCHLQVEETYNRDGVHTGTNFKLVGHDLEEFTAVIERHGVWLKDVEDFREALESTGPQLTFDLVSQPDSATKEAKAA